MNIQDLVTQLNNVENLTGLGKEDCLKLMDLQVKQDIALELHRIHTELTVLDDIREAINGR